MSLLSTELIDVGRRIFGTGLPMAVILAVVVGCSTVVTSTPEPSPVTIDAPLPSPTSMLPLSPTLTPTVLSQGDATPTAVPTETITPPATPTVGPTPPPTLVEATLTPLPREIFTAAPDRDLYSLAQSLVLKSGEPIPRVVNPEPVSYRAGREDTFWLTDIQDVRAYTSQATLRLVSPHAYWYVEEGVDITQRSLEDAAEIFEDEIYPRVTAVFGAEWVPGVDNDPHLTIVHARLRGVAGYYSSVDEYPVSVHQFSNQREMIYMSNSLRVGSPEYLSTLSHELQHAVHWNGDPSEDTWVNEGLSEVAARVAGYRPRSQDAFVGSPTTSIVNWPVGAPSSVYYGGAFLFFDYLATHYGSLHDLALLVAEPLDGIPGIDAYLSRLGFNVTFRDVFKDWIVANVLDQPGDGPYSHPNNELKVRVAAPIGKEGQRRSSIPQYSAEYSRIDLIKGDIRLRFQGQSLNSVLPLSLEGGRCWWSNRGDSISSTLTRPLELSEVDSATLKYRTWFDVEEDWDYGYVQISTDGGSSWDIIQAPGTSPKNPVGNSFGPGYTGVSDGWIDEEVDLTPYVGQRVLLRFHYVTDDAIHGAGLCFDDISVPDIGFADAGSVDDGWQAEGFVSIDNVVPQEYIVQVIEIGDETRVEEMALAEDNRGEIVIKGLEDLDDALVVVAALTHGTLQGASYTLTIEPTP